jgi:hypothetical protein
MEQRCGPLAVEIVPGKYCYFNTYLDKRARAQSGACAELQFPEFKTELWSHGSRIFPEMLCDFSNSLAKGARAQSGACAEGHFPDYGTLLWSPGSRNYSRRAGKHCDFSTYFTKRARVQFYCMRRGAAS